jgi:hypothetical protein
MAATQWVPDTAFAHGCLRQHAQPLADAEVDLGRRDTPAGFDAQPAVFNCSGG